MEDELPKASGRGPILVKPETWELMRRKLQEAGIDFDPRYFEEKRQGRRKMVTMRLPVQDEANKGAGRAPQYAPQGVRKISGEGSVTWGVKPNHGVIVEMVTRGGEGQDGTLEHIPLIEPAATAEDPTPTKAPLNGTQEIVIADGDFVWVEYFTTDMGDVKSEEPGEGADDERPKIGYGSEVPESTHYQPPNPDESEGTEGHYYVKLFQISEDAGTGGATIQVFCNSDVFHYHELWTGENLGGGGRPFKKRDAVDDKSLFRSTRGNWGITETETDEEIELDWWVENVGTGVPLVIIPDPLEDGPGEVRTLRGLSSSEASAEGISPQLQIELVNEPGEGLPEAQMKNVRFRGNGKKGSRVWLQCDETTEIARIEWADGFITSEGDVNIIVGDCPSTETEPPGGG